MPEAAVTWLTYRSCDRARLTRASGDTPTDMTQTLKTERTEFIRISKSKGGGENKSKG
jgi:hypothetical protein